MTKLENDEIKVYHRDSDAYKVCCSCDHRLANKDCCDIDEHYIGYVNCFECWCRHWTNKEYKKLFDNNGVNKECINDTQGTD